MPSYSHLVDELYLAVPQDQRASFLYLAGITTGEMPVDLLDRELWLERNRPLMATAFLRRFNFSDEQIARLYSEGDVMLNPHGTPLRLTLRFSFGTPTGLPSDGEIPLTDLGLASGIGMELFRDIAAALQPLGAQTDPPSVRVGSGSVTFTVAGTPLAAGVGAVLYCLAGVPMNMAIRIGGAITASLGVIDLALSWQEKVAEIRRKNSESAKLVAESEKLGAEARKLDAEAHSLPAPADAASTISGPGSFAMSSLVDPATVTSIAQSLGMSDVLANHVLNRGLPAATQARKYLGKLDVELIKGAGK